VPGRLRVGTSGFAYAGWAPRFYPADLSPERRLEFYASQLGAVELNNTFYRQPSSAAVTSWLGATPDDFRFAIKAQRGGSFRAMQVDPDASVPWLTGPYRAFGARLGTVLFRVPEGVNRDDARLIALLRAWPRDMPLTIEFQAGAALCTTELPENAEPPTIRRTGPFLYLRLRRHDYRPDELAAWADRLEPFLVAGDDAFVFFRHDEAGRGPELARALVEAITVRLG
jgi:uncharacterized protein YecE (DUF72 family)